MTYTLVDRLIDDHWVCFCLCECMFLCKYVRIYVCMYVYKQSYLICRKAAYQMQIAALGEQMNGMFVVRPVMIEPKPMTVEIIVAT